VLNGPDVIFSRSHLLATLLVVATIGSSCAVFPDRAVLPTHEDDDDDMAAGGSFDGEHGFAGAEGAIGQGGSLGETMSVAGAPVGASLGVEAETSAGAGGQPATRACHNPRTVRVPVVADTWIDAADRNARHGSEPVLSIMAGDAERRALFAFTVPPLPDGSVLEHAAFLLNLHGNADPARVLRSLRLYHLDTSFVETLASWMRSDKGSKWQLAGGDFGDEAARAIVPPGTTRGVVTFDITPAIGAITAGPATLEWIVLETDGNGSSGGELSFSSKDQDAIEPPTLVLEYCDG
jgi:hypothetical protein